MSVPYTVKVELSVCCVCYLFMSIDISLFTMKETFTVFANASYRLKCINEQS